MGNEVYCAFMVIIDRNESIRSFYRRFIFHSIRFVTTFIPNIYYTTGASPYKSTTLADKMIEEACKCINDAGKIRDGASVFLARILTRPDMSKQQLPDFLTWSGNQLNPSADPFLVNSSYNYLPT